MTNAAADAWRSAQDRAPACDFCEIVAGRAFALHIYEDEHAIAFLDRLPMTVGHCLVIPRRHVTDVWELTDDDAAHVMQAARRVAHLVRDRLAPAGVNLLSNSGRAAGQTQFHLHLHVVPRYGNDLLLRPPERLFPQDLQIAEQIASARLQIPEAHRLLSAADGHASAAVTPNN